LNIKRLHQQV